MNEPYQTLFNHLQNNAHGTQWIIDGQGQVFQGSVEEARAWETVLNDKVEPETMLVIRQVIAPHFFWAALVRGLQASENSNESSLSLLDCAVCIDRSGRGDMSSGIDDQALVDLMTLHRWYRLEVSNLMLSGAGWNALLRTLPTLSLESLTWQAVYQRTESNAGLQVTTNATHALTDALRVEQGMALLTASMQDTLKTFALVGYALGDALAQTVQERLITAPQLKTLDVSRNAWTLDGAANWLRWGLDRGVTVTTTRLKPAVDELLVLENTVSDWFHDLFSTGNHALLQRIPERFQRGYVRVGSQLFRYLSHQLILIPLDANQIAHFDQALGITQRTQSGIYPLQKAALGAIRQMTNCHAVETDGQPRKAATKNLKVLADTDTSTQWGRIDFTALNEIQRFSWPLQWRQSSHLRSVQLWGCHLDHETAERLPVAWPPRLEKLIMRNLSFVEEGDFANLLRTLPTTLFILSLIEHALSLQEKTAFFEGLRQLILLNSLELRDMGLREADGTQLATVLGHTPQLQTLILQSTDNPLPIPALRNELSDTGLIALLQGLPSSLHVHYLDVAANGITDQAMPILANWLRSRRIGELRLSSNAITNAGILNLIPALMRHPSLRRLNLFGNALSSEGIQAIARIFITNNVLTQLNLEESLVDQAAIQAFVKVFSDNTASAIRLSGLKLWPENHPCRTLIQNYKASPETVRPKSLFEELALKLDHYLEAQTAKIRLPGLEVMALPNEHPLAESLRAIVNGEEDTLRTLHTGGACDVFLLEDLQGCTALHYMARHSPALFTQWVSDPGATLAWQSQTENNESQTAWHVLAKYHGINAVRQAPPPASLAGLRDKQGLTVWDVLLSRQVWTFPADCETALRVSRWLLDQCPTLVDALVLHALAAVYPRENGPSLSWNLAAPLNQLPEVGNEAIFFTHPVGTYTLSYLNRQWRQYNLSAYEPRQPIGEAVSVTTDRDMQYAGRLTVFALAIGHALGRELDRVVVDSAFHGIVITTMAFPHEISADCQLEPSVQHLYQALIPRIPLDARSRLQSKLSSYIPQYLPDFDWDAILSGGERNAAHSESARRLQAMLLDREQQLMASMRSSMTSFFTSIGLLTLAELSQPRVPYRGDTLTLVQYCAATEDWALLRFFLQQMQLTSDDQFTLLQVRSKKGTTALHLAMSITTVDALCNPIAPWARESLVEQADAQGDTPLHCAIRNCVANQTDENVALVRKLVNINPKTLEIVNQEGHKPLYAALQSDCQDLLSVLLVDPPKCNPFDGDNTDSALTTVYESLREPLQTYIEQYRETWTRLVLEEPPVIAPLSQPIDLPHDPTTAFTHGFCQTLHPFLVRVSELCNGDYQRRHRVGRAMGASFAAVDLLTEGLPFHFAVHFLRLAVDSGVQFYQQRQSASTESLGAALSTTEGASWLGTLAAELVSQYLDTAQTSDHDNAKPAPEVLGRAAAKRVEAYLKWQSRRSLPDNAVSLMALMLLSVSFPHRWGVRDAFKDSNTAYLIKPVIIITAMIPGQQNTLYHYPKHSDKRYGTLFMTPAQHTALQALQSGEQSYLPHEPKLVPYNP